VVASYPRYEQAQQAVDLLSDGGFSVEKLATEARGIRIVERVTGRMTYGRASGTAGCGFGGDADYSSACCFALQLVCSGRVHPFARSVGAPIVTWGDVSGEDGRASYSRTGPRSRCQ
jgi:hypothetical protein